MFAITFPKMPRTGSNRIESNNSRFLSASAHETGNLVSVRNEKAVTTSLTVARYFGKEHSKVLRAISAMECTSAFRAANFGVSCYQSKNGNVVHTYPMYYLTRDGFTFLAMGFTGRVAARFKEAYIKAFNDMEEQLKEKKETRYATELLRKQVERINDMLDEIRRDGQQKHGKSYGGSGCVQNGLIWLKSRGFEENLRNITAQLIGCFSDSYFFISQLRKAEKENEELKAEIRRFLASVRGKGVL